MTQTIIIAISVMGGLGITIGVLLAAASKIFYVYVDPVILEVEGVLPGANCGGCGVAGCSANAEAIVAGKSSPNSCVAAGPEVGEAIAVILGVSLEAKEPDIALPGCTYGVQDAASKFIYDGVMDCRAALLLGGGMKVCSIGCLGLGTCAKACPFGAIVMGPKGLPVVDEKKCTGCGTCERICPKNIIRLSSITRRILLEYTTSDCTTPCQRACPAGINIRGYIQEIVAGDYSKAVQVIKERNPFPTIIGRICPRPCELDCRRQYVDEPVAINFLKRYAADYEMQTGVHVQPFKAPSTGRKVAVIGGGVEGLSTAFFTARLGHDVEVYESASKPGGILRTAISKQRLPESILDWDIEGVSEMGVKIHTRQGLGTRGITLSGLLKQGFETVFLASGGWDSRLARGEEARLERPIPGTYLLLDILQNGMERSSGKAPAAVVVGGGSLSVEAVKILKGVGVEDITLVFRESEDQLGMEAMDREALETSGVKFCCATALTRLFGEEDGLSGMEGENLQTGEKSEIPCGILVLSSGRYPEMIFDRKKQDIPETDDQPTGPVLWEGVSPYKSTEHVYEIGLNFPGDILTDFSAAIKAIGAGRRAAASIHQRLYGISIHLADEVLTRQSVVQNVNRLEEVQPRARQIMPLCSEKDSGLCDELEKGFDEESAGMEAARCLQCGLICYKDSCEGVVIQERLGKIA
ncbi:MAG: FAD-dependent oxidoreductase [Desulfobacteraceae bacterium]|nr:FAD-dependent oxidoreductase [Desulfobacteraceae bacterium]